MKRKYLILIMGILILSSSIVSISLKEKHSNKPCYYFVSEDEVKLDGINSKEIDLYTNEDGGFFFLTKENKTQIPECK